MRTRYYSTNENGELFAWQYNRDTIEVSTDANVMATDRTNGQPEKLRLYLTNEAARLLRDQLNAVLP